MELYKDYPRLCTIWCFIEILFYAGQLFGWSSLLYVLKQEGFYNELCIYTSTENITIDKADIIHSLYTNNSLVKQSTPEKDVTAAANAIDVILEHGNNTVQNYYNYTIENADNNVPYIQWQEYTPDNVGNIGCTEQDARLNLWFSTAICVSYVMCSIMGPILQKIGMRNFRLVFLLTYIIGALCLGFATPEIPWLVCPGLCCIGVAGMALYSTNIHVSFLFPAVQSTITAVFVGLYDASTVVTYLMKVAFDGGIPRKYYYIGLSVVHLVLIGTSTFLFLPCIRIKPRHSNTRTGKPEKILRDEQEEKQKFIQNQNKGNSIDFENTVEKFL
ncbi:large neutral amino acids transporter small subunit 4-like [Mercenaria mercenaria]|uniref:large neutral amino acids transporter small subunit 4-like n=1 Tax=Mercenaria mercenaria TaxID=6596 RepID=UPI00234E76EA|nr:large neutral amino acids transporter small subunit 4-like [Mercenaria mercenaria]